MEAYRYTLEKSSRKHLCPSCSKQRFVRYFDIETNQYLPDHYGRCDREAECTYHLNPYSDGYIEKSSGDDFINNQASARFSTTILQKPKHNALIPFEVLARTRQGWELNIFLQNLINRIPYPFLASDIEKIIGQYQLGTVLKGYMAGAVTFPFIDERNRIRAIQVKLFNESNHTTSTSFLHSIIEQNLKELGKQIPEWLKTYNKNESKVTCMFGAHLLSKYPDNPVALVEAPKSAIIGTLYYGFPNKPERLLWLAVYNLSSLSYEKCLALKGRTVVLFPDLSKDGTAFQLWSAKAKSLEEQLPGTRFIVSDILEQKASVTAKTKGLDIADFLIQFNYLSFRNDISDQSAMLKAMDKEIPLTTIPQKENSVPIIVQEDKLKIQNFYSDASTSNANQVSKDLLWEISSLESYFSSIILPQSPIRLNQCTVIHNLSKFISGHLAILKTYNGNPVILPYLNRLHQLKEFI